MEIGVWEIVGSIATLLAGIVGILTYFERKRDKKVAKEKLEDDKKREEWIEEAKKTIQIEYKQEIKETLEDFVTLDQGKAAHDGIKEELGKVNWEMEKVNNKLNENRDLMVKSEKFRLRGEMLAFAEDLRNGADKSSVAYEHIHAVYGRYKELGGNSYIDQVFKYIVGRENEDKKNND